MPEHYDRFLGISEVAELLGVKQSTLYAWVHLRQIPYYKIGRLVKFKKSEIDGWLQQRKVREMAI